MSTATINTRIQYFMEKKDVSIDQLTEATGLDKAFIQTMLAENIYPPLGPLIKIARTLGVRLGTFLDDQETTDPYIVRKAERTSEFSVLAEKNKPVSLNFFSLGMGKSDRHMEPFFIEIMPESASRKVLSSHEGEEWIAVVKGSIEIIYGKESYILEEGDSVYYNSVVPHYVSCNGGTRAHIHAVIYIPE
ncbi:MAG: helix-turn-helix domain-containing protein [Desulfopila sp.]